MRTPTTPDGLRRYDDHDPVRAVVRAWTVPGDRPSWHRRAQGVVRGAMPLLARALDRLADDLERAAMTWPHTFRAELDARCLTCGLLAADEDADGRVYTVSLLGPAEHRRAGS